VEILRRVPQQFALFTARTIRLQSGYSQPTLAVRFIMVFRVVAGSPKI
jgi:hypothetical protein